MSILPRFAVPPPVEKPIRAALPRPCRFVASSRFDRFFGTLRSTSNRREPLLPGRKAGEGTEARVKSLPAQRVFASCTRDREIGKSRIAYKWEEGEERSLDLQGEKSAL